MSPPRARQRNPRGSGQQLRAEIIEAALRVIDADGVNAVTLRSVAREAGIAAPSVYHHFSDLDAVLKAVSEEVINEVEAFIGLGAADRADPVARLLAGAGAYVAYAERYPQRYTAIRAQPEPGRAFRLCVSAISECAAANRSASDDPFRDAVALWSGLHGYASLLTAGRQFPWPERADTIRRIVYGLARITGDDPEEPGVPGRAPVPGRTPPSP